jgi:nucleotide-binding universal stress UspA family protein
MNTLCDIDSNRVQDNDLETEQTGPAEHTGQMYRRILVGTDFSAASNPAFEQGLKLAKQNRAELLIAHATLVPSTLCFMPPECYVEWELRDRAEAEKNIGCFIRHAHEEGVKAHKLLLQGLADDAIIEAAKRLGVDLIVVGTHGHRGVSRLFMGSVAARVVSRAPCAVLITHSSDPATRRISGNLIDSSSASNYQKRKTQTAANRQPRKYAR